MTTPTKKEIKQPSATPYDIKFIPNKGELLVLLPQKKDKHGGIILDSSQSEFYQKFTLTVIKVGEGLEEFNLSPEDEILVRRLYSRDKNDNLVINFDVQGVFQWFKEAKDEGGVKYVDFIYEYAVVSRHQILGKFEKDAALNELR